jgi:hypothetical protein
LSAVKITAFLGQAGKSNGFLTLPELREKNQKRRHPPHSKGLRQQAPISWLAQRKKSHPVGTKDLTRQSYF